MNTEYITEYVNEYGQINIYELLVKIRELVKFRFYHKADKMINELYEISTGTKYNNVNNDLFVMAFSEENEMHALINIISRKLNGGKKA